MNTCVTFVGRCAECHQLVTASEALRVGGVGGIQWVMYHAWCTPLARGAAPDLGRTVLRHAQTGLLEDR